MCEFLFREFPVNQFNFDNGKRFPKVAYNKIKDNILS